MAVFYVDPEGEAGNGTGSSFANRALGTKSTNSTILSNLAAGDEVRIKKSPDPTSLGTGVVSDKWTDGSYYMKDINSVQSWSTTAGESVFYAWSHRIVTGDFIFIQNETALSTHRINGIWQCTKVDDNYFKLDGYVAASTSQGSISGADYSIISGGCYKLNTSNITKMLMGGNDVDYTNNVRPTWTTTSDCTYAQETIPTSNWSSQGADCLYPPISDRFTINANTSAGKVAHVQLDSTLDLSAYQQISIIINQDSADANVNGNIKVCLCSDNSGDTIVDEAVQKFNYNNTSYNGNLWWHNTENTGAALGSSINSIAIYVTNTHTSQMVFNINSLIVSKSTSSNDCLTYNSLVGLNTTADPFWHSVGYIRNDIIVLEKTNKNRGTPAFTYYSGVGYYTSVNSNSATIYVRQPLIFGGIRETWGSQFNNGILNFASISGTSGNPIVVSGGWDTSSMSNQTGSTFVDMKCGQEEFIWMQHCSYIQFSKLGAVRFNTGVYTTGNYSTGTSNYVDMTDIDLICCDYNGADLYSTKFNKLKMNFSFGGQSNRGISLQQIGIAPGSNKADFVLKGRALRNGSGYGVYINDWVPEFLHIHTIDMRGLSSQGLRITSKNDMEIENYYGGCMSQLNSGSNDGSLVVHSDVGGNIVINNVYIEGGTYAMKLNSGITMNNLQHTILTDTDKMMGNGGGYSIWNTNANPNQPVVVLGGQVAKEIRPQSNSYMKLHNLAMNMTGTEIGTSGLANGYVWASDYDQTSGDLRSFYKNHTVYPETSTTQPGSGTAWKQELDSGLGTTNTTPQEFSLGKVAVNGGSQLTVSIYVRRSSTNVFPGIHIKKNGLIGVTSDVSAYITAAADTWQQISASCTPTSSGVLEITLGAYRAGTGDSFYDTFSATQA